MFFPFIIAKENDVKKSYTGSCYFYFVRFEWSFPREKFTEEIRRKVFQIRNRLYALSDDFHDFGLPCRQGC